MPSRVASKHLGIMARNCSGYFHINDIARGRSSTTEACAVERKPGALVWLMANCIGIGSHHGEPMPNGPFWGARLFDIFFRQAGWVGLRKTVRLKRVGAVAGILAQTLSDWAFSCC